MISNLITNILGDNIGRIELVDYMGGDLSIVNAARASFNKSSTSLSEQDCKLINYLIKHKHFSPIRGVVFTFKVKCPLYVSAQWYKHTVASSYVDDQLQWNQLSMRYVDMTNKAEFYIPQTFRQQAKNNKQSSESELNQELNFQLREDYLKTCMQTYEKYCEYIQAGMCREQARGVLSHAIYTTFIWTTSLQAVLNFLDLRQGEGAQNEIKLYADAIESLIQPIVPVTKLAWDGLKRNYA